MLLDIPSTCVKEKLEVPPDRNGHFDTLQSQIARRLIMRRVVMRMTQLDLGNYLGITTNQVQNYESGKSRFEANILEKMAQTLQVSIGYFFLESVKNAGDQFRATNFRSDSQCKEFVGNAQRTGSFLIWPEISQLLKAFSDIHEPEVRKQILDLVKSLALSRLKHL